MHMMFAEEEYEHIVREPFNRHVKDGTPEPLRREIERKLERLNSQGDERGGSRRMRAVE